LTYSRDFSWDCGYKTFQNAGKNKKDIKIGNNFLLHQKLSTLRKNVSDFIELSTFPFLGSSKKFSTFFHLT